MSCGQRIDRESSGEGKRKREEEGEREKKREKNGACSRDREREKNGARARDREGEKNGRAQEGIGKVRSLCHAAEYLMAPIKICVKNEDMRVVFFTVFFFS